MHTGNSLKRRNISSRQQEPMSSVDDYDSFIIERENTFLRKKRSKRINYQANRSCRSESDYYSYELNEDEDNSGN
jgi:hypothetical protein